MAEKGETRILGIFVICIILISISFSGCVEEKNNESKNSNDIKHASPDEVELILEFDNTTIPKNYTSFKGRLIIKNIVIYDIFVSKDFQYGNEIQFSLYNNETNFTTKILHGDPPGNLIKLSQNDTTTYNFDLIYYQFSNPNEGKLDKPNEGKYEIVAIYKYNFISNSKEIEII